ncbi:putative TIR domain, P-loop containing nucleoside triphosphate hydrolase [Helianthus debilis subsp. tardiflorus]
MASSSSSVHNKNCQYEVFLSFSGVDTRKTFVGHLYAALHRHGIKTFKDDERLEKGKNISDELLQSIEDSRCYIIVFSKNYASSSWCLDELLKIMECHNKGKRFAIPVFYDVDPSEVRKQTGAVGKALAKQSNKNESEVGRWREALKEAANLSGWDVRKTSNGDEAEVIKKIVQEVSRKLLQYINIDVDENLIGMEQRMQDLCSCLEIGTNDVRMIGIKGIGGAGKTTLALAIFNKLSMDFEGKSLVEDVKQNASNVSLAKLQEQVLKDVFMDNTVTVSGVRQGKRLMKQRLRGKEVLLVLDDVDNIVQLKMLAGDTNWFKPGSRIIITTRDEQVLKEHKVRWIHDVGLLSDEEAIELFSRYAFGKDIPPQGYEKYSREVVSYAAGLPLTIKTLGSNLCGKDDVHWVCTLLELKPIPLGDTLRKLEVSYEMLEDDHKEIFLDVACFLQGLDLQDAIRILESCGFDAEHGLRVLKHKSLITLEISSKITLEGLPSVTIGMHDQLIEMGKNIVRREHQNKHSRLWIQKDIEQVLAGNSVSEATKCIIPKINRPIFLEGLGNMKKLRSLIVEDNEQLCDRLVNLFWFIYGRLWKHDITRWYLPNSLQYLDWYQYPHWCLPETFEANNLVELNMSHSNIIQLWEGGKVMAKLKILILDNTRLKRLDLGLTPNLQRLHLKWCFDLVELDVHGGCLKSLVLLILNSCWRLKSISFIEQMESLVCLDIGDLELKKFLDYIITGHSINSLRVLNLSYNRNIEVPSSICSLQQLRILNLRNTCIEELPENLGQLECLEYLDLSCTKVKYLPGSICMLKHLNTLLLRGCELLEKLPEGVHQLESLENLDLELCINLRM